MSRTKKQGKSESKEITLYIPLPTAAANSLA